MQMLSNTLALCATSALAGAMVLIWRVLGSYWQSLPPAALLDWFGTYGPMVRQVMFPLVGLGFFGLSASLWLDRANRRARLVWIGALVCFAGVGWITLVYVMPLNQAFETRAVPPDHVGTALTSWLNWHLARVLLGLGAAVLSVVALGRPVPAPTIYAVWPASGRGLPPQ